jgi:hypothetical protein
MSRLGRAKRLLGVGRDDLRVGTFLRAGGIHPVEGFTYSPDERFFTPQDFGFLFIL